MNNIQKILDSVLTPLQDVENALMQCLTERSVDNATGINLDVIGKLVGESRHGLEDDDYRRCVRARIAANRSSGTVEDMLKVARLIINDTAAHYKLRNHGNAQQQLTIHDVATSDDLAALLMRFVNDTHAAGVRTVVEYGTADPATWAHFDTGLDFDTGVFTGSIDQ